MKKHLIFSLSIILTLNCVNLVAQNPFCERSCSPVAHNTVDPNSKNIPIVREKSYHSAHFEEEGCSFRFVLISPAGGRMVGCRNTNYCRWSGLWNGYLALGHPLL